MYDLLEKFENIIILRTVMNEIDLNFIGLNDLEHIARVADACHIDLDVTNFETIEYNDQYQDICDVFDDWYDDVDYMYHDIKNGLLRLI